MPVPAKLHPDGKSYLQSRLDEAADSLPGCTLAVVNTQGVLFSGATGPFDILDPSRKLSTHDVMWFASTTKLLTAICYLQLVDRGALALDTDMRLKFSPLDTAASRIIKGFENGKPQFEDYRGPVPLLSLLNQSSGLNEESKELKEWREAEGASISDKVENVLHTPLSFTPGSSWDYGNSADWLGIMLPTFVGIEMEEYLQEHVLQPLGLKNTTFYPFGTEWEGRLMPMRYRTADEKWVELTDQEPDLTYPRTSREDVNYPLGGGGIYSCSEDYALVLQYLLQHYLSLSGQCDRPVICLLSDKSVASLFEPTLSQGGKKPIADFLGRVVGHPVAEGEGDWSTGMAIYLGPGVDGERNSGSVQWGGISGTQFWIDVKAGIAVVSSTSALAAGPGKGFGKVMEKAVYSALEKS